jgi:hypothetical protein
MNKFLSAHYESLKHKYKRLTSVEKKDLVASLADQRLIRVHIIRANPRAIQQDIHFDGGGGGSD